MSSILHPAYVAGLIDGEGYIGFSSAKLMRDSFIYPYIRVQMTNREIIESLRAQYGGTFGKARDKNPRCALCYVWSAGNRQIPPILKDIWPFLIVKRDSAAILAYALPTYDSDRKVTVKGRRGRVLHPEDLAARMEAYEWSKKANSKGPAGKESPPAHIVSAAEQYIATLNLWDTAPGCVGPLLDVGSS